MDRDTADVSGSELDFTGMDARANPDAQRLQNVPKCGAGATSGGLMVARRLIAGRLSLNVEFDLRQSLYTHLQGMSFGFYDKHQTGQLLSRATSDVSAVRMFLGYGLVFITQYGASLIAASVLLVPEAGGWALPRRNARGTLQPDAAKFPQGIKPVADYVHSLGLKFGLYASAGTQNCAATSAGSYGHYRLDAATFASWGVDYIKLDWCSIPYRSQPQLTHLQLNEMLAAQMASALAVTGRATVFDINNPANDHPRGSAHGLANMWRTTPDIQDTYPSMIMNFTHNVNQLERGPGGWNDPDMLEIGNGGMTSTEYQSQLSLWAEMAAPLIAGNDLSTMSRATRSILTNLAVIAVDQDRLGRQGYPVASANGHWVLTKPLANGDRAVVLFNQTDSSATISTTLAQVGLTSSAGYMLLNLWSGAATETAGVITASVPPHGVVFYGIAKSVTRPFTT